MTSVTSAGKLFHVRAAATGNARSPTGIEVDKNLIKLSLL